MRVRILYRFGRLWLSFAAVLLGLLAGYLVGRESILHSTKGRLVDYAESLLLHDEEIAVEVTSTLKKADASPYAMCSDQDIAQLRSLTFEARFLKDVGRTHDHQFLCSATVGKLPAPVPMVAPDVILPSGVAIYRNYPLSVPAGDRAEIAGYRDADVVLSPLEFSEFPQYPISYSVGVFERAKRQLYSRIPASPPIPPAVFDTQEVVRRGDTFYVSRCSSRFEICAVSSIAMQTIWISNHALMNTYIGTGGSAGVLCAMAFLFAGQKRRSQTNQLKRAILMGKLSVAYQPIVELETHRIVGAEALARWTDEDGESIRPETILALAEAEGFVSEITRFVVTRSLEELQPIFANQPDFRVNINLAPSDLADPRLLLLLDENLHPNIHIGAISARNLNFELTERATSDRDVAVAAIRRLRQRGHAVFIDDFGTGYSNLAYLTELNVDGIKINRSFIATLGTDSVTATIVPQILAVAKALKLEVVVQGIERAEQASYFVAADSHILGQGWFFGQPIPARSLMYLCAEKSE